MTRRRRLAGRTIVVTRPRAQAGPFSRLLRDLGARVLEAPAIRLAPPRSWRRLESALHRADGYDLVIFTSVNGVERFFARLGRRRTGRRLLCDATLVAIGPATRAALRGRGFKVAALPEEYRAEGLVRLLGGRALYGTRILVPRAAAARDLLLRALRAGGARVDDVPVYRMVSTARGFPAVRRALRAGRLDLITFTSSSTVEHFTRKFRSATDRRLLRRVPVAVIGPVTARTARRHGYRTVVQPRRSTMPSLARAIAVRLRSGAVVD